MEGVIPVRQKVSLPLRVRKVDHFLRRRIGRAEFDSARAGWIGGPQVPSVHHPPTFADLHPGDSRTRGGGGIDQLLEHCSRGHPVGIVRNRGRRRILPAQFNQAEVYVKIVVRRQGIYIRVVVGAVPIRVRLAGIGSCREFAEVVEAIRIPVPGQIGNVRAKEAVAIGPGQIPIGKHFDCPRQWRRLVPRRVLGPVGDRVDIDRITNQKTVRVSDRPRNCGALN